MEATHAGAVSAVPPQTHPLLLLAAASVTALSLAGVGVLAGWLPGPGTGHALPAPLLAAADAPPIPASPHIVVAKKIARPVAEANRDRPVSARRDAPSPAAAHPDPATARAPARAPAPLPRRIAAAPAPTFPAAVPDAAYRVATPPPICNECGVVEIVREVPVEATGSGAGAIAGGLAGGLLGNQVGKGSGRSIATVLGAVGGAFAGNHAEKMLREGKRYDVVVRFDDGGTRSFSSETPPAWRSGDRVRLQNGLLTMGDGKSPGSPAMI
ncbi:MAG: glycine zipper 2TM domain-containing protein [Sulfuritalea sp.]|nr:glycine zipper 2TM domain-containing protein [Sulfuritalea sp.]